MDSRPPLAHDIFFTSGEARAMAMTWVFWASVAFAGGMLVFVIWTRARRRRRFEANRAEIERIAGHYGISLDDAYDLLDLPPDELNDRARQIALDNR